MKNVQQNDKNIHQNDYRQVYTSNPLTYSMVSRNQPSKDDQDVQMVEEFVQPRKLGLSVTSNDNPSKKVELDDNWAIEPKLG